MTINQISHVALGAPRKLLVATLLILAAMTAGCEKSRDVSNDPKYFNFSTVTGFWKTKQTLTLVNWNGELTLCTSRRCEMLDKTAKVLAALPPGTEISVEHLVLHPSFECDTYTRTGSLVTGPWAGRPLELDAYLFALNPINTYYTGSPMPPSLPSNWQVNPDQLEK
ncbi:MAG TPA: hypothetical protein VHS31_12440 [Tepidisphaeraceae bacterium]|nr:hypothetical protein [Tepidisphaeraceae bacterium]